MLSQEKLAQLKQLSATPPDLECLREAAIHIYDLYLSEKVSIVRDLLHLHLVSK